MWRDQIISIEHGKIQKLARGLHAHRMLSNVFGPGPAVTVAIKSCHRIATTAAKLSAKNIRRHKRYCVEAMKRSSVEARIVSRTVHLTI